MRTPFTWVPLALWRSSSRTAPLRRSSRACTARDVPFGQVDDVVLPPSDGDFLAVEGDLLAVPLVVFDDQLHGSTRPLPEPAPCYKARPHEREGR